jgi:AbrB family looped-hinge helix DNA binding protein
MKSRVIIDKAGRITIPKPLRKELHLEPGDTLDVESANERLLFRL